MSLDRRRFLLGSAGALAAGSLGAGAGALASDPAAAEPAATAPPGASTRVPFDGLHQAGILTPRPAQATFLALDAIAADRAALIQALQGLSARARELARGGPVPRLEIDDPPADSGTLGPVVTPDGLTVTIALGASLFDHRYGLAHARPRGLVRMPAFPDDALDPARSHGDLLLTLCAHQRDTVVHALRELMRPVRGALALRWAIDGFSAPDRGPSRAGAPRNLFAFHDGTGNPDSTDAAAMRRLVWVGAGAGEPAWTRGGTYQVLRTIRMHVEFWDRVGLLEQEQMIGRTRDTGAPLGGRSDLQDPRYDLDPKGERIPLDAHIRVANPRTRVTAAQRILRRGYSYHRGFDEAGQLDQGLVFCAFNQDIERQFATIQRRLAGEPMVDYITPVGGGYFFAPPGAAGGADWVGSGMFAA